MRGLIGLMLVFAACGGGAAATDAAVPSDGGLDAGWQTDLGAGLLATTAGPVQGTVTDGVAAWPAFDGDEHYLELTRPSAAQTGYRQAICQQFAVLF